MVYHVPQLRGMLKFYGYGEGIKSSKLSCLLTRIARRAMWDGVCEKPWAWHVEMPELMPGGRLVGSMGHHLPLARQLQVP